MQIFLKSRVKKTLIPVLVIILVVAIVYGLSRTPQAQAQVTISSSGTVTNATGRGDQNHLIYAVNDAAWWMFYIDSTDNTLMRTQRSTGLSTWVAGATLTLLKKHNSDGANFAVAYANISSNDVVHVAIFYCLLAGGNPCDAVTASTDREENHVRATISGGTLTWGTESHLETLATSDTSHTRDGVSVAYDSSNKIFQSGGWFNDTSPCIFGDMKGAVSTNADAGSSWTAGFGASQCINGTGNTQRHSVMASLGSGNMVIVTTNAGSGTFTDLDYVKYSGNWGSGSATSIRGSVFSPAQDQNDFGAVRISNTNVELVMKTGTNTFELWSYDGNTTWTHKTDPATQNTVAASGIFLATDNTDFWLFIIDSDAANTLRYNKYTVATDSWGGWTAFETTTQTRNWISGYQLVSTNQIAVIWSQTNGSNFDIVVEALSLGGAAARAAGTASEKVRGGTKVRGGVKFR